MVYGRRMGQSRGMLQRKKKMARPPTMLSVCMRTARVWRRRWRGTFMGAKRILRRSALYALNGVHVNLLALGPSRASLSSCGELRVPALEVGSSVCFGDLELLLRLHTRQHIAIAIALAISVRVCSVHVFLCLLALFAAERPVRAAR